MATPENLNLLWGATAIGRALGVSPKVAFYLLSKGEIPGRKVGGRWVADADALRTFFSTRATEAAHG